MAEPFMAENEKPDTDKMTSVGCTDTVSANADDVIAKVNSHPRTREILYKTLVMLEKRMPYSEAEELIQQFHEYRMCLMSPAALLDILAKAGGIDKIAVKIDGCDLTEADRDGRDEDEVDDLIERFDVVTTEAGRQASAALAPEKRYESLLASHCAQQKGYEEILAFCSEKKRRRQEIEALVAGKEYCAIDAKSGIDHVLPSHFLEKLEKAGMLEWDNGWKTSGAGERYLRGKGA